MRDIRDSKTVKIYPKAIFVKENIIFSKEYFFIYGDGQDFLINEKKISHFIFKEYKNNFDFFEKDETLYLLFNQKNLEELNKLVNSESFLKEYGLLYFKDETAVKNIKFDEFKTIKRNNVYLINSIFFIVELTDDYFNYQINVDMAMANLSKLNNALENLNISNEFKHYLNKKNSFQIAENKIELYNDNIIILDFYIPKLFNIKDYIDFRHIMTIKTINSEISLVTLAFYLKKD